jgi:hypothetical protein
MVLQGVLTQKRPETPKNSRILKNETSRGQPPPPTVLSPTAGRKKTNEE